MTIIDTHAHLDHLEDIDEALQRAAIEGVEAIIAVSENIQACQKNLEISQKFNAPKVHVAMGIHPSDARMDEFPETLEYIKENIDNIIAIGEVGLDFWYRWVRKNDEKKEEQKKVFRAMLELAKDNDLPAIIHSRGAWKHCLEIVKDVGIQRAEFHWYSGPIDILDAILDCGYYVSATPSLAYSPEAIEAIKHAPLERILIETDTPVYYRNRDTDGGFKAEPKDVFKTLDFCSEVKGVDQSMALEQLNTNARDFFSL